MIANGHRCDTCNVISIDKTCLIGFSALYKLLCLIIINTYNEYIVVEKQDTISRIKIVFEIIKDDIIIAISLTKFNLGGRAMFVMIVLSHIIEVIGILDIMPPIIRILREFVFSYIVLVSMNMHDEVNPWVTIIVALPNIPNLELEVILIINRPI